MSDKPVTTAGEEDELALGRKAFHKCAFALGADQKVVGEKMERFMQEMSDAFDHALGDGNTNMTTLSLYAMAVEELTNQARSSKGWSDEQYLQAAQFAAEVFSQMMELLCGMRLAQNAGRGNVIVTQ